MLVTPSGLDDNYKELVHRLQPTLTQVVELLNEDSKISIAFFDEIKEVIKDENSPSHKAYNDLKTELETLIDGLPVNVRKSLAALAVRTQIKANNVEQELNQFKKEVEDWFERSMDRASGVYKRNAKGVAFLIGFIVAAIANADTFHIVSRLSSDDALQKAIVDSASQAVTVNGDGDGDIEGMKTKVKKALTDISLPIGWTPDNLKQQRNEDVYFYMHYMQQGKEGKYRLFFRGLKRFLGWIVSGLAIVMGAPFWFELLGKFINVRNTGKKPASPVDTQVGSRDRTTPPET